MSERKCPRCEYGMLGGSEVYPDWCDSCGYPPSPPAAPRERARVSTPARWVIGILAAIGAITIGGCLTRYLPDHCRDAQRHHDAAAIYRECT